MNIRIAMMMTAFAAVALGLVGCTTATRRYQDGEVRQTVAGFSEEDIQDTINRAVTSIFEKDRIKPLPGQNRAIMIIEDITIDTLTRGRDAGPLAEALGISLRENITESCRAVVYNKQAAQYAKVKLEPQYRLAGRLSERNMRQDNGDYQKEFNLNLTLVDLATGLEFWQKRIHVGKEVDAKNLMN